MFAVHLAVSAGTHHTLKFIHLLLASSFVAGRTCPLSVEGTWLAVSVVSVPTQGFLLLFRIFSTVLSIGD